MLPGPMIKLGIPCRESLLASLLKEFEFQMRENVRVIEDRASQQKLSKEAERRITRLRREKFSAIGRTIG